MSTYYAPGAVSKTGAATRPGPDLASSTSALMILPPGPVPAMLARLTPLAFAVF